MAMIDNRKDILLLLLALPGASGQPYEPVLGRTRLTKLLFLLDREKAISKRLHLRNYYAFEAYHYGPFSRDVFDDVDFLRNVGIIEGATAGTMAQAEFVEGSKLAEEANDEGDLASSYDEERFELTERGRLFVTKNLLPIDPEIEADISRLKTEAGGMSLSSLLRYVYTRFPESATRSRLRNLAS